MSKFVYQFLDGGHEANLVVQTQKMSQELVQYTNRVNRSRFAFLKKEKLDTSETSKGLKEAGDGDSYLLHS